MTSEPNLEETPPDRRAKRRSKPVISGAIIAGLVASVIAHAVLSIFVSGVTGAMLLIGIAFAIGFGGVFALLAVGAAVQILAILGEVTLGILAAMVAAIAAVFSIFT